MPSVTFITPSGEKVVVPDAQGNLMSAAIAHQVEGIDGDCGGVCSCATCHVHVDAAWIDQVGEASDIERGMLELQDEATDCSRLGCQVELTAELDGLVVRVARR